MGFVRTPSANNDYRFSRKKTLHKIAFGVRFAKNAFLQFFNATVLRRVSSCTEAHGLLATVWYNEIEHY